ncbi:hypothetical protein AWH56_008710 [Anaerobacillus isosaccharinicus]|uniref:Uncharacterized protein n=2 Tax=Anaerobacillus isosaccharinicus TaxID=1532552 RepID=A0A7S7LB40_9BACI|nr:hypothetical protein [Anaerobacillus isosaccharinicus]MBA5588946.1 hypothetical protein [Anaerobacillus isosaccharinicus]QOY37645.1 hypothetical protein AWH56_008710 [Anaerobacillus isosaccharinicus]
MGYYIRSLENVKKWRNMPWLKYLMTVEVNGKMGKVTGANSNLNINVRFDDPQNKRYNGNCHPHWETRYFDKDGNVIADYRDNVQTN